MQDAAVLEIIDLIERIDPAKDRKLERGPICPGDRCFHFLARLHARKAIDGNGFIAREPDQFQLDPSAKVKGTMPMPTKFER